MSVITRFAPSPTGYLHIGSARTAIFNYLYAKHFNGKFLLRIEDTDKQRSTEEATNAIIKGLNWLGVNHDDEIVFQSEKAKRHAEVAYELLNKGLAYKCFVEQAEIDKQRNATIDQGKSFLFRSPWREVLESEHPKDKDFVIRLKAPYEGKSTIKDLVQGEVSVSNEVLDDMVLLRSDGTPTYMLAVVVDDFDMKVTHIIRGDDHLNNAFRQKLIYEAMGWNVPIMAHIPLIHGTDGAKLSKRHGAVGVEAYRDMGYLPEALFNYLLRLGWSHGDDDIISKENAIAWFDGTHIGKAPSRMDFAKMNHINANYIKNYDGQKLLAIIEDIWSKENIALDERSRENILKAMNEIKVRSALTFHIAEIAKIYHSGDIFGVDVEALEIIKSTEKELINQICIELFNLADFAKDSIQALFKSIAENRSIKLGELMKPVRAFVTGKTASPSVFEIMEVIGKEASIKRLRDPKI